MGPLTLDLLRSAGIVAIARAADDSRLMDVAETLIEAGVTTLEFPLTTPGALAAINRIADRFGDQAWIGAGTVVTVDEAAAAIDAGARFIVTPVTNPAVIEYAREHDIAVLPGAFTPTEIHTAWSAGATAVKVFPAATLGPGYVKAVRDPFPQIPLVPTGGVSLDNATAYFAAGAVALGLGGPLIGDALSGGSLVAVAERAAAFLQVAGDRS